MISELPLLFNLNDTSFAITITADGARSNAAKLMVIITDGESNDEIATMRESREAKNAGQTSF